METALDLPGLSQMEFFMIITPLPEIREEIDFKHVFDIDKEDIKLLNEARTELIAAMKDCLDNVRLIISSAETYLERLVEALGKVETIKTKKKQTIEWGRIFSEVGKTKVKIKPKCKDHYRVEVYMIVHTLAVLYKQQAERVI